MSFNNGLPMNYQQYMPMNYYPQNMFSPQNNQMNTQQNSQDTNYICWVQGEVGAKAYPVGSGNNVFLFDSDDNNFYLKSADQSGVPTMKSYVYFEQNDIEAMQEYIQKNKDINKNTNIDALNILNSLDDKYVSVEKFNNFTSMLENRLEEIFNKTLRNSSVNQISSMNMSNNSNSNVNSDPSKKTITEIRLNENGKGVTVNG